MPIERSGVTEGASVQATPATPANPEADPDRAQPSTAGPLPGTPTPSEEPPSVKPSNPLKKIAAALGGLLSLLLLATVACTPNTAPSHNEAGSEDDAAAVQSVERPSWLPAQVPFFQTANSIEEPTKWRAHLDVVKCLGEVVVCTPDQAYEVASADQNLLMTAGATALWNGLSTSGLGTPFSTTNAQLAVGDSSTAPAVTDTDLNAVLGTKLNAADATSCTNATPIVCSATMSPSAVAGQVYNFSGFSGAGAAAINGTFEASAGSGSSITLLNSAGTGSITITGGLIKPVNKYRQQANASGSAVVTNNQVVYVATFGTTNGNFAWNEWGLTTGAAATNKQATPPPTLFNHAAPGGGLGTKTSAASWTLTVTLSLS